MKIQSKPLLPSLYIETVSRETIERLNLYKDLLLEWNKSINLISRKTTADIWDRHILDSAQLWNYCPSNAISWLDVGSGGGFPGMVISIIAAERNPKLSVTLVESNNKKCFFLREVVRRLELKTNIFCDRIENLKSQNFHVLSARAFTKLVALLAISSEHLSNDGISLFLKGKNANFEIAEAEKFWHFKKTIHKSFSNQGGCVLEIRNNTCAKN